MLSLPSLVGLRTRQGQSQGFQDRTGRAILSWMALVRAPLMVTVAPGKTIQVYVPKEHKEEVESWLENFQRTRGAFSSAERSASAAARSAVRWMLLLAGHTTQCTFIRIISKASVSDRTGLLFACL